MAMTAFEQKWTEQFLAQMGKKVNEVTRCEVIDVLFDFIEAAVEEKVERMKQKEEDNGHKPVDHSEGVCGHYPCCYDPGECEGKCTAGFKEFIRACNADRKQREMEEDNE
jgi:hypothetical protein